MDLTQQARTRDEALGWLARACGRRLTTANRLVGAVGLRAKVRWRAELLQALSDVAAGCHSLLELRYLRDVERAHRLPAAGRQVARRRQGGRWCDDVYYRRYRMRVELDGAVAHPDESRWRDMRRDNAAVVGGDAVLRFGWTDVAESPCSVAGQVATVLRHHGWRGLARRCGRSCMIR